METLKCTKLQYHTYAEKQEWLLLFDKPTETGSEIAYLLQHGETILAVFDIDGYFEHLNDNCNATIEVENNEERDDD